MFSKPSPELVPLIENDDTKRAVITGYLRTKNNEYNLSSYMFENNYFQWY